MDPLLLSQPARSVKKARASIAVQLILTISISLDTCRRLAKGAQVIKLLVIDYRSPVRTAKKRLEIDEMMPRPCRAG